jgi:Ubiquitin-activating enzyme active site
LLDMHVPAHSEFVEIAAKLRGRVYSSAMPAQSSPAGEGLQQQVLRDDTSNTNLTQLTQELQYDQEENPQKVQSPDPDVTKETVQAVLDRIEPIRRKKIASLVQSEEFEKDDLTLVSLVSINLHSIYYLVMPS